METGCPDDRDTLLFHCPHPNQCCLPPLSVGVCVCTLWVFVRRVRVRWQPASHCPIIPAPLTLCILLGFLLMRERVRENGRQETSWRNREKRRRRRRTGESLSRAQKWCKSTKTLQTWTIVCVLPCVPMVNSPLGAAYLQSTVQERVCQFGFECLRVWRWRAMLLWFYKSTLNAC